MKLSKALKLKNRLAGEIAKLKTAIQMHNSEKEGTESEFDVEALMSKLNLRIMDLVDVKAAIAVANANAGLAGLMASKEMCENSNHRRIFHLAELKGMIEFLKSVSTKFGTFNEGFAVSGAPYEVTYEVTYREKDISDIVDETQRLIDVIQDEIDTFNASAEADVDGIKV
jgi:hypothetical protein